MFNYWLDALIIYNDSSLVAQIKKCSDPACAFCSMSGPRLPPEVFAELHFLPDSVEGEETNKYLPFDKVYGQKTTEKDCPSVKAKSKPSEQDKKNRNVLVSGKYVATIAKCTTLKLEALVISSKVFFVCTVVPHICSCLKINHNPHCEHVDENTGQALRHTCIQVLYICTVGQASIAELQNTYFYSTSPRLLH